MVTICLECDYFSPSYELEEKGDKIVNSLKKWSGLCSDVGR